MNHFLSVEVSSFLKSMMFDFGFFLWFPIAIFVLSTSLWVRRLCLAMLFLILFYGTSIFPIYGARMLAWLGGEDSLSNCPASAIVILAGGVSDERTPNLTTQLRLRHGAAISTALDLPFIYSGWQTDLPLPESEIMATFAKSSLMLSPRETYLERESRTTHENAIYTAQLLDRLSLEKNVVLVTSSWHMLRARLSFEKAGVNICRSPSPAPELNKFWDISFQNARDSRIVLNEMFGLIAYLIAGWI